MRRYNRITRGFFSLLGLGLVSNMLVGCIDLMGNVATASSTLIGLPFLSVHPSDTLSPNSTLIPSAIPFSSGMPSPVVTFSPSYTFQLERVGAVILNGQEIGTIQKSGKKFQYVADPDTLTPEVNGKVVLKLKDPREMWGFNLESSSSPMYNLKDDPRNGWEAYGVLVAYRGRYEITVKFIALNVHTEERIKGRVNIEVVGVTPLATDTPEIGWYPAP